MIRLLCAVGVFVGTSAAGADVLVIGDSWGTHGADEFQKMFSSRGVTKKIDNAAIGGTTTEDWIRRKNDITKLVTGNPNATHMWVTLGGNDAFKQMPLCTKISTQAKCINKILGRAEKNFAEIASIVYKANPKLRMMGFGYDIMAFQKLPLCPSAVAGVLPDCHKGGPNITCVNHAFVNIQYAVENVAKTNKNMDAINILGTLQAAGKMEGASVGHPVMDHYSPARLYEENCIHPTTIEGFKDVFDSVWNLYFKNQVGFGRNVTKVEK